MGFEKEIVNNTIGLSQMRTWQSGLLQSTVTRVTRRLSDEYLKQYDLTTMHWLIIGAILDHGDDGIRVTDLARKAGTTLSYMTTTLNLLEDQGKVTRIQSDFDSRTRVMIIPKSYRKTCLEIEDGLREVFRANIYSKISRQQLENYITVLQILAADEDVL